MNNSPLGRSCDKQTLYLWITCSNWNRKLVAKAHARVQFCSFVPIPCMLISTQENKHRTVFHLVLSTPPHHKVENTSTRYHRIIGSNWNRKLIPKAHVRVQFCSDPVRSHAYYIPNIPLSGNRLISMFDINVICPQDFWTIVSSNFP